MALAEAGRGDWILCQITSNPYGDSQVTMLTNASFASGSLRLTSYARSAKLFTADRALMVTQVGILKVGAFKQIVEIVINILRASLSP